MSWEEAPKYSANTINEYYDALLSCMLTEFDENQFMTSVKETIVLNEEQEHLFTDLCKKVAEESKEKIVYTDYSKIIASQKYKLLSRIYELLDNDSNFAAFMEKLYPDEKIKDMIRLINFKFEWKIATAVIMQQKEEQFKMHCSIYRRQITDMLSENSKSNAIGMLISNAQKSLTTMFMTMYINRDGSENWQNPSSSV